jgi:choline dehydrogenase
VTAAATAAFTPDYIVIGSGAGGGTVAARLAENGARVLVIEAGGDPNFSDAEGMPEDYEVPAFNAQASENPATAWNFGVRHYADPVRAARDPKLMADGRILYPRAAALGGCTAHNAMIFMAPVDSDWDAIAAETGDPSWSASAMRHYWQKVERCNYHPFWKLLYRLTGWNPTGHGWDGWLDTQTAMPTEAFTDRAMLSTMLLSARAAFDEQSRFRLGATISALVRLVIGKGDPNDRRINAREGIWYEPISAKDHSRRGARERLLDVQRRFPDRLHIVLHALATRLLLDDAGRCTGVEYATGGRLYGAHPAPHGPATGKVQVFAAREVIVSGGAFNTPQLLMLSGIGPRADLEALGIACRVDLPGVGGNLQDRYEVGVVNRMATPWKALIGASFTRNDPLFAEWMRRGKGMYGSNGVAIAVTRRSRTSKPLPDLFLMALLARFGGYRPGYSTDVARYHDALTWAVLMSHTANRAGRVSLVSADPMATPDVSFNYFDTGNDPGDKDLQAVVRGVHIARHIVNPLMRAGMIAEELVPGRAVTGEALRDWVRDNAWGHHASCSAAIGPRDAGGVLDGRFRVHGVPGLRVVDACVFPRIPGYFIVSAIYMIGEKAADVIWEDTGGTP